MNPSSPKCTSPPNSPVSTKASPCSTLWLRRNGHRLLQRQGQTLPRFSKWITPVGTHAFPLFAHLLNCLSLTFSLPFFLVHTPFSAWDTSQNAPQRSTVVHLACHRRLLKISVGTKANPETAKAADTTTVPSKASQEQSTLAKLPLLALK